MREIILLGVAAASISFTISETKLFKSFREWTKAKNKFWGELFSCGYCLGHWASFALVAIFRPKLFESWWLLDYFLTALVIAWLSGAQWIVMCWLMKETGK